MTKSTPEKTLSVSHRAMTGTPTDVASLMACQSALGSVTRTTWGSAWWGCRGFEIRPGMNLPMMGTVLVNSANFSTGVFPYSRDETARTLEGSILAMNLEATRIF